MFQANKFRDSFQKQQALNSIRPEYRVKLEEIMKLLDNATNEILMSEDWNTNMVIVDAVNSCRSDDLMCEIVRQIRKKLQNRSLKTVSLALSLTETLMKNCEDDFYKQIATEKFMGQMIKLAQAHLQSSDREALKVSDHALDLIQAWGEAFLPRRGQYPLFVNTYHNLKAKGLPFKKDYDESRAPVFTPKSAAPNILPVPQSSNMRVSSMSDADLEPVYEVAVMAESCAETLEGSIKMANNLQELEENDLTTELVSYAHEQEARVIMVIQEVVDLNPEAVEGLTQSLEKIQAALKLYSDIRAGAVTLPLKTGREAERSQSQAAVASNSDMFDLLGFDPSTTSVPVPVKGPAPTGPPPPPENQKISKLAPPPDRKVMPKLAPSSRDTSRFSTAPSIRGPKKTSNREATDLLGGLDEQFAGVSIQQAPVPPVPNQRSAASQQLFDIFSTTPAAQNQAPPSSNQQPNKTQQVLDLFNTPPPQTQAPQPFQPFGVPSGQPSGKAPGANPILPSNINTQPANPLSNAPGLHHFQTAAPAIRPPQQAQMTPSIDPFNPASANAPRGGASMTPMLDVFNPSNANASRNSGLQQSQAFGGPQQAPSQPFQDPFNPTVANRPANASAPSQPFQDPFNPTVANRPANASAPAQPFQDPFNQSANRPINTPAPAQPIQDPFNPASVNRPANISAPAQSFPDPFNPPSANRSVNAPVSAMQFHTAQPQSYKQSQDPFSAQALPISSNPFQIPASQNKPPDNIPASYPTQNNNQLDVFAVPTNKPPGAPTYQTPQQHSVFATVPGGFQSPANPFDLSFPAVESQKPQTNSSQNISGNPFG